MDQQAPAGGAAKDVPSDRRTGADRRSGVDRRGVHEERRTQESFGGVGHKSGSFFDHPWWVAGTVVFGIVMGVVIMKMTTAPKAPVAKAPPGGIDVIVKPAE